MRLKRYLWQERKRQVYSNKEIVKENMCIMKWCEKENITEQENITFDRYQDTKK